MGEGRYNYTCYERRHLMEVGGQLHVPAALYKEPTRRKCKEEELLTLPSVIALVQKLLKDRMSHEISTPNYRNL
jgi:hypothetical protein